jgi:hypothetical protein
MSRSQIAEKMRPHSRANQHHVLAFADDRLAPWISPAWSFAFTCAAKTIATMPNGRQQQIVLRMAGTR